jgi:uncharacterized protein YcaQ
VAGIREGSFDGGFARGQHGPDVIELANRPFRRALVRLSGLARSWEGDPLPAPDALQGADWVEGMVRRLGFVQVDSVAAVARAQHQILLSRNPRFRRRALRDCLEQRRTLFESWTHDHAILPTELYPYWKHNFRRFERYEVHPGYERYFSFIDDDDLELVRRRIEKEGALMPRDVDSGRVEWTAEGASFRAPSRAKVAMERLWRIGELAVARREGREKVFDLASRIIPTEHYEREVSYEEYVDFTCRQALLRLGAASPSQICRYFEAVSRQDAERWCGRHAGDDLLEVRIRYADGGASAGAHYALASFVEGLDDVPPPSRRLRLLSPFDPLIHDRLRTARVFGFDYTLEMFVPKKKRQYGYYVLPILEGDRFIGRLDAKAERRKKVLRVLGLWWEPGVEAIATRKRGLERELERLAVFLGAGRVAGGGAC